MLRLRADNSSNAVLVNKDKCDAIQSRLMHSMTCTPSEPWRSMDIVCHKDVAATLGLQVVMLRSGQYSFR